MVESLYIVPEWFYVLDIVLGMIFAIVTVIVAVQALKIYKITKERELELLGIAFASISLSYLLRVTINTILTEILNTPGKFVNPAYLEHISLTFIYAYAFLFIIGYVTFAYTTLKMRSKRIYFLMLAPSLLAFAASEDKSMTLYLTTVLFILPIVYHYGLLYFKTKDRRRLNLFVATLLLLMSNLVFIFIADYLFYEGYIISSALELVAYSAISFSLYKIIKHGEKKK